MPKHINSRRPGMAGLILIVFGITVSNASAFDYRGHIKFQSIASNLPANSLLQDFSDDPAMDNNLELRLNLSANAGEWSWKADYQLLFKQGDGLSLAQQNPGFGFVSSPVTDDQRRVFDLTHVISEHDGEIIAHRLDRFYLNHTSDKTVFRFGRQAISWGNGTIYNPMDFFNPFDPAAVDTEYKTGDDMLYAQYLFDNGDDLQAVWVGRRDDNRDISNRVSSLAIKYHGFLDQAEFDVLVAEHHDQSVIALGGSIDIAGSIWRSDVVITESVSSAVINGSYSWQGWGKNIITTVEYYHNGFGIDDGSYDPTSLGNNGELLARLQRGELFTLGENYLSATATIELTPLWLLTTSVFNNLDDNSSLLQFLSLHDLQQNLQLFVSVSLPTGGEGSEFGGIDSSIPGRPVAIDESLFVQLAWYF